MRVAVTRPKERAGETIKLVESRGWEAIIVPTIEVVPRSRSEVLASVGDVRDYDWLVLTSAFGAEIMHDYFGGSLKALNIAAIGPKTGEVLEKRGIEVHFVPSTYRAEGLAEGLLSRGVEGKKLLFARASRVRGVLSGELSGAADVKEVVLYDALVPEDASGVRELEAAVERDEVDAIIFTSSQSAKNLFEMSRDVVSGLRDITVCAIGPITAGTLEGLDVKVDVVSKTYTIEGALNSLEKRLKDG